MKPILWEADMGLLPLAETKEILQKIRARKAVLIGDLCLDVYWSCDMTKSHLSRETAHFPLPVVEERTSAGGGGWHFCGDHQITIPTLYDRVMEKM